MASLERQSPDLVISAGSFDDEVLLARALLESGVRAKAVGLAAAAMQEFPQALGTYAEGFLGPSQWEPRLACVPPRISRRCVASGRAALAERTGSGTGHRAGHDAEP